VVTAAPRSLLRHSVMAFRISRSRCSMRFCCSAIVFAATLKCASSGVDNTIDSIAACACALSFTLGWMPASRCS
jgi:hypothetical protein